MSSDDIQYLRGFGLKDVVAWGSTGLVVLDAATRTVIKTPFDEDNQPSIERERQIYVRLASRGAHPGILSYHGVFEGNGIRLEYASNHDLQSFIEGQSTSNDLRLRWMIQIAEALAFIHDAGIIHGDLTTANIFLDKGLNAKLADFAGSSIDSLPLLVAVTPSHEYPGDLLSVRGDIFAFASAMYEVWTGQRPYADLEDADIQKRYAKREYPDTTALGSLGRIIRTCWEGGYDSSGSLAKDLRGQHWIILLHFRILYSLTLAGNRYPGCIKYTPSGYTWAEHNPPSDHLWHFCHRPHFLRLFEVDWKKKPVARHTTIAEYGTM
jgi:serine/threonine protein kinase